MKITIDTKEDSPSEIRKAIKMLNALVGETRSNIFEDTDTEESSGAFSSMFGGESETETAEKDEADDEDDDTPQVIEY